MPRETEVLLDTADLRSALSAVVKHVSPSKDDAPALQGVRVLVDPTTQHVYVMATDRYTLALARVSIWEDLAGYGSAGVVELDLSVDDVADVLRIFRPVGKDGPQERVRLRVDTPLALTLTDASGLFTMPDQDRTLTLPVQCHEGFPDVRRILARLVRTAMALLAESRDSAGSPVIAADAAYTARFAAAGKAYARPLYHLQSAEARAAILYRVGDSFLGALMPLAVDDFEESLLAGDLRTWRRILPTPRRDPVPMPQAPSTSTTDPDPSDDESEAPQ